MNDLEEALRNVKKSPGLDIKRYEEWNNKHGSAWFVYYYELTINLKFLLFSLVLSS